MRSKRVFFSSSFLPVSSSLPVLRSSGWIVSNQTMLRGLCMLHCHCSYNVPSLRPSSVSGHWGEEAVWPGVPAGLPVHGGLRAETRGAAPDQRCCSRQGELNLVLQNIQESDTNVYAKFRLPLGLACKRYEIIFYQQQIRMYKWQWYKYKIHTGDLWLFV